MTSTIRARSALGIAALQLSGSLASCADQEGPTTVVEATSEPSRSAVGSAVGQVAAKGRELMAVATVRAWITDRNEALATGDTSADDVLAGRVCGTCARHLRGGRWAVESARVTQHTVDSATVAARITVAGQGRIAVEFEVTRVGGTPMVTKVAVLP